MEMKDLITLVGVVVGAIIGFVNLWITIRTKTDKFRVKYGSLRPPLSSGHSMYVVSCCDHQICLADYGFILRSGRLLSLPQLWIDEPNDKWSSPLIDGSSVLEKRGDIFSVSYQELHDEVVGAYCQSAAQDRPRVGFRHDISKWSRLVISIRTVFAPNMA